MSDPALAAAYAATTYRVPGIGDLRLGQAVPAALAGLASWAVITAENPASQRRSEIDNAQRQAALVGEIRQAGYRSHVTEHHADAGDWPVEVGCLVEDISLTQAVALAKKFGQSAILFGRGGKVPELYWVQAFAQ